MIDSINFEAYATVHAVAFVPLPGDYRQPLSSKQGLKMMRGKPLRLDSKQLLEAMLTTADAAMAGTEILAISTGGIANNPSFRQRGFLSERVEALPLHLSSHRQLLVQFRRTSKIELV